MANVGEKKIVELVGKQFSLEVEKHGLNTSELSRNSGINRQSLIYIHQGKVLPLIKNAVKLEKAVGLEAGWFEKEYSELLGKEAE